MSEVKFSVVIPAYNAEKYIENSVGSVLSQTYGNFEILIVDDGSTDRTGEICDGFRDERIRVIHKRNGGPYLARRLGIENATGDYVVFLDSDDSFDPGYLESAAGEIEKENPDIIIYSFLFVGEETTEYAASSERTVITEPSDLHRFRKTFLTESRYNSLWMKVIRRSLTGRPLIAPDSDYEKFFTGEDFVESVTPVLKAEKIVLSPECRYNYNDVEDGLTKKPNPYRYRFILEMKRYREKLIRELGYDDAETVSHLAGNSFNAVAVCVKEIARSDVPHKKKKEIFREICRDGFFREFIEKNVNYRTVDRKNLILYYLLKLKFYRVITLLVK